jgi:hypothetical protein
VLQVFVARSSSSKPPANFAALPFKLLSRCGESSCSNRKDDDGYLGADCLDSQCDDFVDCRVERLHCSDGIDNDNING